MFDYFKTHYRIVQFVGSNKYYVQRKSCLSKNWITVNDYNDYDYAYECFKRLSGQDNRQVLLLIDTTEKANGKVD